MLRPESAAHAVDLGGGHAEADLEVSIDALIDARDDAEILGVHRVVEIEEEDPFVSIGGYVRRKSFAGTDPCMNATVSSLSYGP